MLQAFTELERTPIYVEFHRTPDAYMTNTFGTLFRDCWKNSRMVHNMSAMYMRERDRKKWWLCSVYLFYDSALNQLNESFREKSAIRKKCGGIHLAEFFPLVQHLLKLFQ